MGDPYLHAGYSSPCNEFQFLLRQITTWTVQDIPVKHYIECFGVEYVDLKIFSLYFVGMEKFSSSWRSHMFCSQWISSYWFLKMNAKLLILLQNYIYTNNECL
jgi:hypothetical protein